MSAVRIQVVVPEDRQLTISLPHEVTPGEAEVIVLTRRAGHAAGVAALLDLVDSWRRQHPHRRSKQDIDRRLDEERGAGEAR